MWAQRLKVEVMWVVRSISGLNSPKGVAHSTLPHPSHSSNHAHTLEQNRGSFSPSFSSLNIKIKNKIPSHLYPHISAICLTSQAGSPSWVISPSQEGAASTLYLELLVHHSPSSEPLPFLCQNYRNTVAEPHTPSCQHPEETSWGLHTRLKRKGRWPMKGKEDFEKECS